MTLTDEQIQKIRRFISSRGFTQIDLQDEIIDHVASSVEEKLEANPELDFDKAVKETHATFGVMGFSEMEEAFVKSAQAKMLRKIGSLLKAYFGMEKYGFGYVIFISLYFLFRQPILFEWVFYGLGTSLFLFFIVSLFRTNITRLSKKYTAAVIYHGLINAPMFVLIQIWLQAWNFFPGLFKNPDHALAYPAFQIILPAFFTILILEVLIGTELYSDLTQRIQKMKKMERV
ncbi:hypothetical protein FUAX_03150 [Fulvitalea axinellae]|uniref:CPBP family intramembrane metalloprotease n=1 Tax=Fulvitalea axinellae TaxID=1182444 RepID=A0AAU9CWC9_9BACT|nr:hypothetical protein FUAX_03150 [Fulvitalea axinellae]